MLTQGGEQYFLNSDAVRLQKLFYEWSHQNCK